jgi:hypothetical protein
LDFAHDPAPVRAVAALAPRALAAFPELRGRTARALRQTAQDAARGLRWGRAIPLAWHGSLFHDRALLELFVRKLGRRFSPRPLALEPEVAAAALSW